VALVLLGLVGYVLYMSGDYFVPFKSPLWLGLVAFLLVVGIASRIYMTYKPDVKSIGIALVEYWTLVVLLVAVLAGGVLRYQTLRNSPPLSPSEEAFTTQAIAVIFESNWKPKSFSQPPLYLYLGAGLTELAFLQQASASPEAVKSVNPKTVADYLRYLNLALGLVSLVLVYITTTKLWGGRREGAIAAFLLATSWLAYQATPALLPQTLAATLAMGSFYFMVRRHARWDWLWVGLLAGLATAANYGAVLLILPAIILVFGQTKVSRRVALGLGLLGWLVSFTLVVPGWILSLNDFISGVALVKGAAEDAGGYYLKQALSNDTGIVLVFGIALILAFGLRGEKAKRLWAVLAFSLAYLVVLNIAGPEISERVALIMPFVAVAATLPVGLAADRVQIWLDAHEDHHKWGGGAFALGLVLLIALISVAVRRFS